MTAETTIHVPNVLGGAPDMAETLLFRIAAAQPGRRVRLDLSAVTWIRPYGAVILLGACRYLAQLGGSSVTIVGLRDAVHAYLRRIDFFEHAGEAASTPDPFDVANDWSRSVASSNVLELVTVGDPLDVYEVGSRARKILGYWLSGAAYDIDQIVSLLAEACSNVVDHNRDVDVVTIQKYERGRYVDVELAISDLGIGIRRSLAAVHGDLADTCAGYIERALAGLTARPSGRGGQGLGAMQRIATASGGNLFIRSETGRVLVQPTGSTKCDGLAFLPGTHVAVTFRSQAY